MARRPAVIATVARPVPRTTGAVAVLSLLVAAASLARAQDAAIPELTAPVNDFAHVIDADSARQIDALIRSLQQASGDVVVVATVPTYKPYADINEYTVKMFENHGRGIGSRSKDNGLLIVLAVEDRRVRIEPGYDLEQFVTDGFAGQTIRDDMAPEFRNGAYGRGLLAGVQRLVARIAEGRNVKLEGVRVPPPAPPGPGSGGSLLITLFVLFILINAIAGRLRGGRRRRWYSGVGPFGGGFGGFGGFGGRGGGGFGGGGFGGGGFGGGGFGGGFGGFGGGRSGGGGASGSW